MALEKGELPTPGGIQGEAALPSAQKFPWEFLCQAEHVDFEGSVQCFQRPPGWGLPVSRTFLRVQAQSQHPPPPAPNRADGVTEMVIMMTTLMA